MDLVILRKSVSRRLPCSPEAFKLVDSSLMDRTRESCVVYSWARDGIVERWISMADGSSSNSSNSSILFFVRNRNTFLKTTWIVEVVVLFAVAALGVVAEQVVVDIAARGYYDPSMH
jgi:hypothetical protein